MATVINYPGETTAGNQSGAGVVLGVILAIVLVALFVAYGLPALRGNSDASRNTTDINVQVPTPNPSPNPAPSPAPNP